MRHLLITIVATLLLSFTPARAQVELNTDNLSTVQARGIINIIAATLNNGGAPKSTEMPPMKISIENNVMIYTIYVDDFRATSPDLVRFFIACNRPEADRLPEIMQMMTILDKAGYSIGYRYVGHTTQEAIMSTDEFRNLVSAPLDQLGFNMNEILTSLIELCNSSSAEFINSGIFSSYQASIDGAFLKFEGTTTTTNPVLSNDNLNPKIRGNLANMLLNGPRSYGVKALIKAARALKLKGVKYDISDPDGNQRILTMTWDELERLAAETPEATSSPAGNYAQLSRTEARKALAEVAVALSGASATEAFQQRTGTDARLDAILDGDILIINLYGDDMALATPELAKFFYACDRAPEKFPSVKAITDLLRAGGCEVSYRYFDNISGTSPVITMQLSPDEIIDLKTKPLTELGFDFDNLSDQLCRAFDTQCRKEAAADEDVLQGEAVREGKYITLRYTFATSQEHLSSGESPVDIKQILLKYIIRETDAHSEPLLRLITTGENLGLLGLKFNFRDIHGHQNVYTASWQEIKDAIANYDSDTEVINQLLDAIDEAMNEAWQEEGLKWTQSHDIDNETLYIAITCDQTEREFSQYLGIFEKSILLDLYAESLQAVFELTPSLEEVTIGAIINGDQLATYETLTREEILEYTPTPEIENLDKETYMDEDGKIHT